MNEKTSVKAKKSYKAPVLSEYGDIRRITQTTSSGHPHPDSGANNGHKTNG